MSFLQKVLHTIRTHTLVLIFCAAGLAAAFTTGLPPAGEMAGVVPGGKPSPVDLVEAAAGFPARIEGEFNRGFTGRQTLVQAVYRFRLRVLGEKDFHDVVVGKDGWLYYSGEKNLDYYQRVELMTPGQIDQLLQQLSGWREALADNGTAFYVVVAPNKESIYPEYLPEGIARGESPSLLDSLLAANRDPQLVIIDLRPALLTAREDGRVYYLGDTHWNPEGALIAYREIAGRIGEDFPAVQPYGREDFDAAPEVISGDLAAMLMMKDEFAEESFELEPRFTRRALTEDAGDGVVLKSRSDDRTLPTAMIFRDSFFNGLQPFLMEHFSEAVVVRSFRLDMDWIMEEKPDLVILEVAERYLPELLEQ